MSEHIKWTREELAQHLDEWDAAMSKGEAVSLTLHAANGYPFPDSMAYWIESPIGVVSLTLTQAQIVEEWLERKRHPRKEHESRSMRDTQFAGFAEKLERDLHFLAFGMYHNHHTGDEVMLAYRKMIAQRAYDFATHIYKHAINANTSDPEVGLRYIPDLTTWPEEDSE